MKGIGPPRNPTPKLAPRAPPKTDKTNITEIEENIIINFGFKNILYYI